MLSSMRLTRLVYEPIRPLNMLLMRMLVVGNDCVAAAVAGVVDWIDDLVGLTSTELLHKSPTNTVAHTPFSISSSTSHVAAVPPPPTPHCKATDSVRDEQSVGRMHARNELTV
jgi:hypothetical protein